MSLFDAIFDGVTHDNARRGREVAVRNGQMQARGFNMILNKLEEISGRLERVENDVAALRDARQGPR